MARTTEDLLEEALALEPGERADLAATLVGSLDSPGDSEIEEAWAREVERRVADVEEGKVETIPWSQARAQLLKRLHGGPVA
jgi:putative addiction module component (TIGR02574 family)